jgi:hypothetical protein
MRCDSGALQLRGGEGPVVAQKRRSIQLADWSACWGKADPEQTRFSGAPAVHERRNPIKSH